MYPPLLHIVEGGGIFVRYIFIALTILFIAYIVKTDLNEGTYSSAAFYTEDTCTQETIGNSITIQIHEGDTLQTIFALHPSPVETTFLERLALFYELNPHLRKQALLPGDMVELPLFTYKPNTCKNN